MNTNEQTPAEAVAYHYKVIAPLIMCTGVGDGRTTACVMAQAATIDALRNGKTLDAPTDEMECACPVLRRLAIQANDGNWWESDEERTTVLRPLIPLLLDSRGDEALTLKRYFLVTDNAVRVLTPMRLDFIAAHTKKEDHKSHALAGAEALRGLTPIIDRATALAAREVCQEWNREAYVYADPSAYAYAYAYDSIDSYAHAYAHVYISADAYADASASTYTDAPIDALKAQRRKYRDALLALFHEIAATTAG